MNGVQELALVQATVYPKGATLPYTFLLEHEQELWWFQDAQAETVWDVIDNPDLAPGQTGMFQSPAILFHLTAIANPDAAPDGDPSYLGTAIAAGQDAVPGLFEPTEVALLADVALRHNLSRFALPWVAFIGVFDVVFDQYRTADGGKDGFSCGAMFLGELDLNTKLPTTTTSLEMDILRAIPQGKFWHFGEIAQCFQGVDSWRLRSAVERLVVDELLTFQTSLSPSRYTLSDKGLQALAS